MPDEIKELVRMSLAFATADQVQGGGGNSSVKIDDKQMLIKASGFELGEMNDQSGYTTVDYTQIATFIKEHELNLESDTAYNNCLQLNNLGGLRPSMETGFHALLDNFVIHTHSVYANVLTCSKEGQTLIKTSIKDLNGNPALLIPYTSPGFMISKNIYQYLQDYRMQWQAEPQLIFLANHGVIISTPTVDDIFLLEEELRKTIAKFINLTKFPLRPNTVDQQHVLNNILFPDQAIYLTAKLDLAGTVSASALGLKEQRAIQDTLSAYFYILENILAANWTPIYINKKNIEHLNNMESESYRRGIINS